VTTYRGNVDRDWWSRVIQRHESYGSGPTPERLTGWICTLFPYKHDGESFEIRHYIMSNNLPKGLVECPFVVNDNGFRSVIARASMVACLCSTSWPRVWRYQD
jgi:hypothetical protein